MNFLQTSRVLVIDDRPDEVQSVIDALGKLGVGCIYLHGDRAEDLPVVPFAGIRLVVLDMRLGVTGADAQPAKMTATVFHRVISADQGPVLVLLWTKHQEDVADFCTALFALDEKFKSVLLIANLEKPSSVGPRDAARVLRKVKKLAKDWMPMNLLWHWEQLAHNAATATTVLVARHVTESAGIEALDNQAARKTKWLARLKVILRQLAAAAGGKAASQKSAHADLLETFLALHADRVEHESMQAGKVELGDLFTVPTGNIVARHAAKLNSMLLLAACGAETVELRPGNIYLRHAGAIRNILFNRTGIKTRLLADEVLANFEKDDEYKRQHQAAGHAKDAQPTADQREAAVRRDKRRTELRAQCIPMLMELSPSCDFAQQSRCVVRFAGGLLVPESMAGVINGKKDSLWPLKQLVEVPGKNGLWLLVFSARFFFSIPLSKDFTDTKPDFRLRTQVLGDLRNWYSAQSARLGYLSV
jgi:hypothetical protein